MHAMTHARRSQSRDRYVAGRARSVAHLLGLCPLDVESTVSEMARDGIDPDVALDWIVLESVR
jgi:hypothetical protein